jgi:rhodanese-related sulfurtransferase
MFFSKKDTNSNELELLEYQKSGAAIIDVRTEEEFENGHIEGSINMELSTIPAQISAIKELDKKIIMVCLSGGRSHQAVQFLKQHQIDAVNGGGWEQLSAILAQGDSLD